MKNKESMAWGIVLIILGVLIGTKALGFININLFFDGWWTLLIIIPCFIGLLTDKEKTGSIIGILIGIFLLLANRNIISFDLIWKLALPVILIILGLSMIFKNTFNKEVKNKIKKLNKTIEKEEEHFSVLQGQNINYEDKEFQGTTLNSIFGGIELDLKNSSIKDEAIINATCIFGGIDLYIPEDTKVIIKSNSILGGVSDNRKRKVKETKKTIYLNATCIFGGIDIK